MEQRIFAYIKEWKMIGKNDKVIAGISGGADSVCLLFVLAKLKNDVGFDMLAVHVHHGLRGEEADADEAYVKRLCESLGIGLICYHEQADEYAKEKGLSIEEAGRELRRQRLLQALRECGGTRIALAHHQNDNVETVLFHLCRGTGLRGAAGIAPKNGVWIHPLLCVTRREIETYLTGQDIAWCTDRTNLENHYTRNRLRNCVVPYLEEHINTQASAHIHEFAGQVQRVLVFLEEETERYVQLCTHQVEGKWSGSFLFEEVFCGIPEALKPYVILEWMSRAAGKRKNLSQVHVYMIEELLKKQTGRVCVLPYGMTAVREYKGIFLQSDSKGKGKRQAEIPGMAPEAPEGKNGLQCSEKAPDSICRMRVFEKSVKTQTFPENIYTKWFDYAIIKNAVKIRHRQPGDFIVINREGRKQKLKQYFINEKIPRHERDQVWLVADGSQIMWIVGYRQSQAYQITETTTQILEIEFYGVEENGRDGKGIDSGRGN